MLIPFSKNLGKINFNFKGEISIMAQNVQTEVFPLVKMAGAHNSGG